MKKRFVAATLAAAMTMGMSMTAMAEVKQYQPGQTMTWTHMTGGTAKSVTVNAVSLEEAVTDAGYAALIRAAASAQNLDIYAIRRDTRHMTEVFTVDSTSFERADARIQGKAHTKYFDANGQECLPTGFYLDAEGYDVTLYNGQIAQLYHVSYIDVSKYGDKMCDVFLVPRDTQYFAYGGRTWGGKNDKGYPDFMMYDQGAETVLKGGTQQTATPTAQKNEWRSDAKGWWVVRPDGSYLVNEWFDDNGKWYYMGADGYMLTNTTTPDGYTVNADGLWVH